VRAAAALIVLLGALPARAEKRQSVVVLEYRAGAKGVPGIGERVAKLLGETAALEVFGPQEARRRGGARMDADLARCGGDALCVGTLGEQLGADEVLLIGVSQLGDLVLAMQRIDAHRGEARARLAESLSRDEDASDETILGWLKQLFPAEVFKRYGRIKVIADLRGAQVSLNGEAQGKTPLAAPLEVRAPATYQVSVQKPGYVPFEATIDVLPDGTVEVKARLVQKEGKLPWYKRWYVWAAVGGAVAAAGIGVAVYFGTRVDETPMGFILKPMPSAPVQ
jgi:hypothetical protein